MVNHVDSYGRYNVCYICEIALINDKDKCIMMTIHHCYVVVVVVVVVVAAAAVVVVVVVVVFSAHFSDCHDPANN